MMDKKYNILLVHNFYQKPGGEDTVFQNEKELLEENGHKVITYTRDNIELKNRLLTKILLPFTIVFNVRTYFDIKKIIKKHSIDIVHVHNTLCLISPSVFYAAVRMKVPVVQTLHNFRMECPNGLFYRDGHICEDCIDRGLWCAVKHKCYRGSFFQTLVIVLMLEIHRFIGIYKKMNLICLTEFNKDKLFLINKYKKIVNENKVFVKCNFVFEEYDDEEKIEVINEKNNKGYYLYVGRLDEIKGIDTVLLAFSKMTDKKIHLIGNGGEEYKKEYSKYLNISFCGQLPHDDVMKEMRKGIALVFASKWYEGLPMTIIESFEQGLPVISCNVGNANELVVEGITGLHFEAGSVDSLIDVINSVDYTKFDNLKENAYSEYKNKYSVKAAYQNLVDIYAAVVANNS